MGINQQESYSDFPNAISEYDTTQNVSEYLNHLVKQYCISELLIPESQWQVYSNQYNIFSGYLPKHPFYEYEKARNIERNKCNIADFTSILHEKIEERIKQTFKNGLHEKQSPSRVILTLIPPTRTQLEDIKNGITEWSLRFSVTKHLTPRYRKDGDKGVYPSYFDIYISEIPGTIGTTVRNANAVVLPSGNRNYKIAILAPKKTEVLTEDRDASIQRSRDAYRGQLMRVVSGGSFSGK